MYFMDKHSPQCYVLLTCSSTTVYLAGWVSVVFSFSFMSHYIAHLHAISRYTLVSSVTLMVCFHALYAHLSFVIFLSHFCIFFSWFCPCSPSVGRFSRCSVAPRVSWMAADSASALGLSCPGGLGHSQ